MANSVVFIDSRIENYQALLAGIAGGAEIVVLSAQQDGLAQIKAYLDGRSSLDAIHLISLGSAGALYLGTTLLNEASLANYAEALRALGRSLTDSGDLLLYGCNVAAGDAGLSFITRLSDLTGADVAASSDLTGAAALGGNATLEVATGSIETTALLSADTLAAWNSVLDANSPVLTGLAASAVYAVQAAPITLAPLLTISDANNANLVSAAVRISAGTFAGDGDVLAANVTGTSITASYNAANETLLLSGADTLAHYQQVLRSVTFSSSSNNPANAGGNTTRTLDWQLNDGTVLVGPLYGAQTTFGAGASAFAVATADVNGDGKLDLAVANQSSNDVSLLLGNGDGTFAAAVNFAAGVNPLSVAIADLNGDGRRDLVIGNLSDISVLLGNGDGTFGAASFFEAGTAQYSVAPGDVNGDGKLDLAVVNQAGVSVLLGNGDGTFAAATSYTTGTFPISVASADLNGDGRLDLAVANTNSDNVSVLLGNGDGTIAAATNFSVGSVPRSVAVADLNSDSKLDLAVVNQGGSVSVLLGNGNGTFAAATNFSAGTTPWGVAIGDVNGDGKLDLAVANQGGVSVLPGNGDGTFAAALNFAAGTDPVTVALGDFDGSGGLDLAVANNFNNNVSVLLNAGTNSSATRQTTVDIPFTFNWSALTNGQSLVFRAAIDVLAIDDATISAAGLGFTLTGIAPFASSFTFGGKSITLQTDIRTLTTANFTFADGSLFLIGDNTTGTAGDGSANALTGGAGNDHLIGFGGNDTLDGGAGIDAVSFGNSTAGVNVNLALGTASDGLGGIDTLANIEIAEGSSHADTLIGSAGANRLDGGAGDDSLAGGDGDDTLIGGHGNDTLDGGLGADSMAGGVGDDVYYVDNALDVVVEIVDQGIDTIITSVSITAPDEVEKFSYVGAPGGGITGNALGNVLTGVTAGSVVFSGLEGDDTITGSAGNDTLNGGADIDTVSYAYSTSAVVIDLEIGQATGSGTDILVDFENAEGGSAADTLIGTSGANTLDGRGGADMMRGGAGDDLYFVDNALDVVVETSNGPSGPIALIALGLAGTIDTVIAAVNYSLTQFVENLTLTGTATTGVGNELDNVITGNPLADALYGYDGKDTIDGGAGADTLIGGLGNDTYTVDTQGDLVFEGPDEGTDTIVAGTSFYLYDNIENLTLAEGAGESGTGNALDNIITGNSRVNSLYGGAGDDILDGGAGADYMLGGVGNDTYIVDNTFDLVDEGGAFPAYIGSAFDVDTITTTVYWFWDVYSVAEIMQIAEGANGSSGAGSTIVGSIFSGAMLGDSGTNIMFGRGGADFYRAGDGIDYISLSLLGLTEQNAYAGVNGVNTIVVDPRTSGDYSYDIVFEFEPGHDIVDISSYHYASAADAMALGVNDGAGNSYYALGDDHLDYLYMVGLTTAQMTAVDFLV